MQEAVPITLGAEFSAFSEAVARDRWRTFKCEERLRVINLGGTAVGSGLTAPRDYIFLVVEKIRDITGFGMARGDNLMGETANADSYTEVSGILKAHAVNIIKIANDLRLLNLLGEIELPDLQTGSSIMPGKINPVMTEAAIQVGIKVKANDLIVAEAASRGTLQINEFLPLVAHALLDSIEILSAIDRLLSVYVQQINANEECCRKYFDESPMIIAALLPEIGYEKATALIKKYYASPAGNIRSFLEEELGKVLVEQTLSPHHLTALGFKSHGRNTERE
jgi:aspartate ammonia-lyase